MPTRHVAIVPQTTELGLDELHQVSAAISIQATRDFGKIWNIDATVDPFFEDAQVPPGYWKVVVLASDAATEEGFHTTANNQPEAYVKYSDLWSLRASHEVLEMLADPYGSHLVPGPALDGSGQTVTYLLEVCDPCESITYAINGITVADFCTERYYDPVAATGVQYSFTGSIQQPLQVLPGGYLSWQDPSARQWWQLQYFGDSPQTVQVDGGELGIRSLREFMDTATRAMRKRPLLNVRKRRPPKARTSGRPKRPQIGDYDK